MTILAQETPHQSRVFHRKIDHEPIYIQSAKGSYLYPKNGGKLLDGCGGAAVVSIGHGDERVIKAMTEQLSTVSYVHSGNFASEPAEQLAAMLTESSGMARAVFYTGGSEALESAIKLSRQYHIENGQVERVHMIARDQSYHGNTLGALALGRHTARRKPYLPLLSSSFYAVSPCYAYRYKLSEEETDEAYVERLAKELEAKFQELGPGTVAAFFAETIVGATSGCTPAVPEYFKAMREVCHRHGALFVLDEIMCGVGRTGKMHAWEWEGVRPDIQVLGKGLGGGYVPISAILISDKVADVMRAGSGAFNNGYTYQSHVVGCRAALEVHRIMKEDGLIEQCHARGEYLEKVLRATFDKHPHVGNIRGRGLFWGIELVKERSTKACFPAHLALADLIVARCMESGLMLYPGKGTFDGVNGDHVIIAPPYIITEAELDFIVVTLKMAVKSVISSIEQWHRK